MASMNSSYDRNVTLEEIRAWLVAGVILLVIVTAWLVKAGPFNQDEQPAVDWERILTTTAVPYDPPVRICFDLDGDGYEGGYGECKTVG